MNFTLKVKAVAVATFAVFGALQAAHAQVDSTGVTALRGNPNLRAPVPPENQAPQYDRAWTAHFVGQTKCIPRRRSAPECYTVQSDGSLVQTNQWGSPVVSRNPNTGVLEAFRLPTPWGLTPLEYNFCGSGMSFRPTGMNAMTGSNPTDWVMMPFSGPDTCGINGGEV